MYDGSLAMHDAFFLFCNINAKKIDKKRELLLQSISMFALCFRVVDIGQDGGGGGGLMGELANLQMDQFSDICQGFNK